MTDNVSNLIKGFRNDTHLRCACHCLNLAIEYGLSTSSDELTIIIDLKGQVSRIHWMEFRENNKFRHDGIVYLYDLIMVNYNDIQLILEERRELEFYLTFI